MMAKVPISDSGMATMGMSTERGEPKKAKITSMTMTSASTKVARHFVDGAVHEIGGVVDDRAINPCGSCD